MNGFSLRQNMAFEWKGEEFRIERMTPRGDVVLECTSTGDVSVIPGALLLKDFGAGRISVVAGRGQSSRLDRLRFSRPLDELSPQVQSEVRRRLHYLKAICVDGPPTFTATCIVPVVKTAAAEIGDDKPPSLSSIARWYRRFQQGQDARLLVPRFDLRGSKEPRQYDLLKPLLLSAVEEAYAVSPVATVEGIHLRLREKIDLQNSKNLLGSPLKHPGRSTVYRLIRRIEAHTLYSFKLGKRAADKKFRLAGPGAETMQILERVEADHTPLDLFLIDDRTLLPLGRPTLTVIVDHFSRMLLGYYLSYGDPSIAAVMGALRHAVLPKQPLDAQVQDCQIEHSWVCYGLPDQLVVDNGMEFHSHDLESVALDMQMHLNFCPKHEPQFKGVVERFLKTVNYSFVHQLPGTSLAKFHLRGDYDPEKHAVMTLGQFRYLFEKWVLDIYAQTVHRGIRTTPWLKWQAGCRARPPQLPQDLAALDRRFGKVETRSLRKGGIELNGIRYNGEALGPILRRFGEGVSVRAMYIPDDLGEIQVWGPDDADPVSVRALDYAYAYGLSEYQHQMIRKFTRESGASVEDRDALQTARSQLVKLVDTLMVSRKHSDRRRAAKIRNVSGELAEIQARPAKPKPETVKPQRPPSVPQSVPASIESSVPRHPYPRFQLKRVRPGQP